MDALLDVATVARRLRCSVWMVYRMIDRGELVASRFGGPKRPTYRIEPAELDRLIESRRVRVARPKPRRIPAFTRYV